MELVFATANNNKVKEMQQLLPDTIKLLNLEEINCMEEIPETQNTIEKNARQKALYVYNNYHINCFADDTGLEVNTLGGRPGVLSARYAGEDKNSTNNIEKLLSEMKGISDRSALFKTIISLVIEGKEIQFEGIVNGIILNEKRGTNGFGYDPIFAPYPENYNELPPDKLLSFAEMDLSNKNKISHRALAVKKLVNYLKDL